MKKCIKNGMLDARNCHIRLQYSYIEIPNKSGVMDTFLKPKIFAV